MTFELINKTVIVLLGAVLFVLFGFVDKEHIFSLYIDWNVIFLLISMMLIVGITKETGAFQYLAIKAAKLAKGEPIIILIFISIITAVASAFLDNVTTVVILTPVCILIAVELGINPVIYVISIAIASNIGGTATLIGDPPNIMIGSAVRSLTFNSFLINLSPVVLVILAIYSIMLFILFRKKLVVPIHKKARIMEFDERKAIENIPLLIKCSIVLSIVILGFLFHSLLDVEPSVISLTGAAVLMAISGKKELHKLFNEVEWETIFFFIGLFILVGGLVYLGIIKGLAELLLSFISKISTSQIESRNLIAIIIIWVSGFFSAFIDNIPYVATMIPLINDIGKHIGGEEMVRPIWWALSLGACLGGNGTLIGASANVISAGLATKSGFKVTFLEFTKYGSIITLISLAISTIYIYFFYLI